MGPRLGHQQSTLRFSVRVFAAHSNHCGTWRNHQLCVSPLCLVLKAAPRDSCDLSSPPSVSSKVMFEGSGNLLRNSLQAPCTLTSFRENRSQTKIGHGVAVTRNNCVRVVLSRGPVFQTWGQNFQRLDRRCYRDRHCTTKVKRLWNFSVPFQRYMHDTMEQKELESTCATPLTHNWAIRWLNLQLSSHPQ